MDKITFEWAMENVCTKQTNPKWFTAFKGSLVEVGRRSAEWGLKINQHFCAFGRMRDRKNSIYIIKLFQSARLAFAIIQIDFDLRRV